MRGRLNMLAVAAIVAGVALVAAPAAAGASTTVPRVTTCDGALAPGTYRRLVVPAGAVCIGDGPVTVRAGVRVGAGATFVLGSEESGPTGTIRGGIVSHDAASVQVHFADITGGVWLFGGSGPFGPPFDVTWNTVEDNHIRGPVVMAGYDGYWMGFIRNHVDGAVVLFHNTVSDPDGNEVVTNTIHGSLLCAGNTPAPQVGDSEGSANVVTGIEAGQCRGL